MADQFSRPAELPASREQLQNRLRAVREQLARLDALEPAELMSEEHERWGERHEQLEDLVDELMDLLDEMEEE